MKVKNNIAKMFGFIPSDNFENLQNELTDVKKSFDNLNSERSFSGAQTSNITSDWNNVFDTINGSIYKGLVRLRARCRDFAKNDAFAKKYLFMLQKNVVGPDGLILRNNATELIFDSKAKKYKRQYDAVANKIIQEAFEDYSLPRHCSVTEDTSFRENCNIIIKTIATDGEILIKPIRDANSKYGYQLQLIEADYLDESYNGSLSNKNIVIMGVEMTPYRKPVAYWLRKVDQYTNMMYGTTITGERIRVPIYDDKGLVQIKHLFVKEHPSQIRGIPWFAPVAIRLRMYSGFEEAILVDARLSANKGLKYSYKDGAIGDEINTANIPGTINATFLNGNPDPSQLIRSNSPGEDIIVPKGMEAEVVDFKSPSGKEDAFQKWALRGIASGLDISFIALANDYSDVNYTSSRTNLLEERDTWKELHSWMRDHFLNWNFEEWLRMALLTQAVPLPLAKFEKFNKPWFQGRAWKWVSPRDEAEAILLMLSNDAWLFEEFLGEQGWTLEEWAEKKKAENEFFDDMGLARPGSNYKQLKPVPMEDEKPVAEDDAAVPKNGKAKKLIEN